MLESVPPAVLADLEARHAEPQRHYHDWTHVAALLRHFAVVKDAVRDPAAVLHAILFHNAIYDPQRSDNEERSAHLLAATDLPIADASKTLALAMVRATDGHSLPSDMDEPNRADTALFLDMNLAILGADRERFDLYEAQIRREYVHVPQEAFIAGRMRVLQSFALRERLYFSVWGRDRFEKCARSNLKRSISRLEQLL